MWCWRRRQGDELQQARQQQLWRAQRVLHSAEAALDAEWELEQSGSERSWAGGRSRREAQALEAAQVGRAQPTEGVQAARVRQ